MVESGKLWDGFGTGLPDDDSFQNVIDILDFPMESLEEDDSVGLEDFQLLGPIPSDILHGYNPVSQANGQRDFQPSDCVPRDANSERKHLPGVTEISSTKVPRDSSQFKESSLSQTPSPVSVLESMFTSPELLIPVRPRTKHQQRPTFTKWPLISLVTPSEMKAKQMKKRKMSQISNDYEILENPFHISSRKCSHCQVTETPQWREGPMGPKTLCNACGVRYRSGRLFPEYRPAASPTFVPSLHSNSHKKVIQMRNESIREPFQGSSG